MNSKYKNFLLAKLLAILLPLFIACNAMSVNTFSTARGNYGSTVANTGLPAGKNSVGGSMVNTMNGANGVIGTTGAYQFINDSNGSSTFVSGTDIITMGNAATATVSLNAQDIVISTLNSNSTAAYAAPSLMSNSSLVVLKSATITTLAHSASDILGVMFFQPATLTIGALPASNNFAFVDFGNVGGTLSLSNTGAISVTTFTKNFQNSDYFFSSAGAISVTNGGVTSSFTLNQTGTAQTTSAVGTLSLNDVATQGYLLSGTIGGTGIPATGTTPPINFWPLAAVNVGSAAGGVYKFTGTVNATNLGIAGGTTTFSNTTTGNLTFSGAGTVAVNNSATFTGNANFAGYASTLQVGDNLATATLTGNISTSTTNNTGTLNLDGTVTGNVGDATNSINLITAGTYRTSSISGSVYASQINIAGHSLALSSAVNAPLTFTAAASATVNSSIGGTVDFNGTVATLTITTNTSAITTAAINNALGGGASALVLNDAGNQGITINGAVGATNAISAIQVQAGTTTLAANASCAVSYTGASTIKINNAATLTGNVAFSNNNGTLTIGDSIGSGTLTGNITSGGTKVGFVNLNGTLTGLVGLTGTTNYVNTITAATNRDSSISGAIFADKIIIGGAHTLSLGDNTTLSTGVSYTAAGTLSVPTGKTLTSNVDLSNSGTLTTIGTGAISGNITTTDGTGTFTFAGGNLAQNIGATGANHAISVLNVGSTAAVATNAHNVYAQTINIGTYGFTQASPDIVNGNVVIANAATYTANSVNLSGDFSGAGKFDIYLDPSNANFLATTNTGVGIMSFNNAGSINKPYSPITANIKNDITIISSGSLAATTVNVDNTRTLTSPAASLSGVIQGTTNGVGTVTLTGGGTIGGANHPSLGAAGNALATASFDGNNYTLNNDIYATAVTAAANSTLTMGASKTIHGALTTSGEVSLAGNNLTVTGLLTTTSSTLDLGTSTLTLESGVTANTALTVNYAFNGPGTASGLLDLNNQAFTANSLANFTVHIDATNTPVLGDVFPLFTNVAGLPTPSIVAVNNTGAGQFTWDGTTKSISYHTLVWQVLTANNSTNPLIMNANINQDGVYLDASYAVINNGATVTGNINFAGYDGVLSVGDSTSTGSVIGNITSGSQEKGTVNLDGIVTGNIGAILASNSINVITAGTYHPASISGTVYAKQVNVGIHGLTLSNNSTIDTALTFTGAGQLTLANGKNLTASTIDFGTNSGTLSIGSGSTVTSNIISSGNNGNIITDGTITGSVGTSSSAISLINAGNNQAATITGQVYANQINVGVNGFTLAGNLNSTNSMAAITATANNSTINLTGTSYANISTGGKTGVTLNFSNGGILSGGTAGNSSNPIATINFNSSNNDIGSMCYAGIANINNNTTVLSGKLYASTINVISNKTLTSSLANLQGTIQGSGKVSLSGGGSFNTANFGSPNSNLGGVTLDNNSYNLGQDIYVSNIAAPTGNSLNITANSTIHGSLNTSGGIVLSNNNLTIADSLTTSNAKIDLGTGSLILQNGATLGGSIEIDTTIDSNNNIGNLMLAGGSISSSVTSMSINISGTPVTGQSYKLFNLGSSSNIFTTNPTILSGLGSNSLGEFIWDPINMTFTYQQSVKNVAAVVQSITNTATSVASSFSNELKADLQRFLSTEFVQTGAAKEAMNDILSIQDSVLQAKAVIALVSNPSEVAAHAASTSTLSAMQNLSAVTSSRMMSQNLGSFDLSYLGTEGISAGSEEGHNQQYGLWIQGVFGKAKQKLASGNPGYVSNQQGAILGLDLKISEQTSVGFAGVYGNSQLKFRDSAQGNKLKTDSYLLSLYLMHNLNDNWFTQAITMFGPTEVKNKELRVVGGDFVVAQSSYANFSYGVDLNTGYNFRLGNNFIIAPTAGLSFKAFNDNGYTEVGAGNQNKTVNKRSGNLFSGLLGIAVGGQVNLGNIQILPGAHFNFSHNFSGKNPLVSSNLDGQVGAFTSRVKPVGKNTYIVGANISTQSGILEYSINYDAILGTKYLGHQGLFKIKVNF